MLKFLPLLIFAALVAFLARGLMLDPREVPSPFIGKAAPEFSLPTLAQASSTAQTFNSADMRGKVWVLNVWASWCSACIGEHPLFVQLAQQRSVPIVGLNYKDVPGDALGWLDRYGNPYTHVLDDREGLVGIDWGVYGVPETFVIDQQGTVQHKFIGPVDPQKMQETMLPLLDRLQGTAS